MSRGAAATTANPVHLIVKKAASIDKTNSLMVSSMPYDGRSITLSREEFQVFLLFHGYLRNTTGIVFNGKPIPNVVLQHVFHFLFNDMLQSTSLPESLRKLDLKDALLLSRPFFLMRDPNTTSADHIHSYFYKYKLQCLLNAALNADLETVNRILEKTKPEQRHILLSAVGCATITHLNIERTGTPLQMALYGHDEEMAAAIKSHMDPAEFQRQWKEVFGPDYNAFLARQQQDANDLCGELGAAFNAMLWAEVDARDGGANALSRLENTLNSFKDNVERYVRENRVHNPYILQRLFEIYNHPFCGDDLGWHSLLSQQAIGVAQKLSSPRWLQHLSQGIYYLEDNNVPARRSFFVYLSDSHPALDTRSLDCLGVDFCIHTHGHLGHRAGEWQWRLMAGGRPRNGRWGPGGAWYPVDRALLQNICQAKTASFQNIMRPEWCCCLVQ